MSNCSKSSSSSSYTAVPFTLEDMSTQNVFDPVQLVQQMLKGFCLPHNDIIHPDKDNDEDDDDCKKQQSFATAVASSKDVPRCIDLISQQTISHGNDRHRLNSYEFDNGDNHSNCATLAIISNDSYDDDHVGDDNYNDTRTDCCRSNDEDDIHNFDAANNEEEHDTVMAVLACSSTANRTTRLAKGLEMFICAVLFFVLTMYMIQKQQEEHQPNIHTCSNLYVYPKIRPSDSSFWGWHYK